MGEENHDIQSSHGDQELERLRSEVQQLKADKERLTQQSRRERQQASMLARNRWAKIMVVFGLILFAFSVSAVWLNRTVMNADRWVATLAPLASKPAIQNYVADKASDEILSNIDVESFVSQALPEQAQPLTAPITNEVENFVRQEARAFTSSQRFENLWTDIATASHRIIVAISTGGGDAISISNGQVTLDIGTVVLNLKARLAAAGLEFVNRIPTGALSDREIVIFESAQLEQISRVLTIMNSTALILPILTLLLLIGAIALAVDRRTIVLWIGAGAILAMILPLGALYLAQYPFIQSLQNLDIPNDVSQAIYSTVFSGLFTLQAWYIAVGFAIWIAAAIAGPSSWAVSLRRGAQDGVQGIVPGRNFGTFGGWVAAHKQTLRIVGYIVAAIALVLPVDLSVAYFLVVPIALLAWLALIEFFGRPRPGQAVSATGAGRGQAAA